MTVIALTPNSSANAAADGRRSPTLYSFLTIRRMISCRIFSCSAPATVLGILQTFKTDANHNLARRFAKTGKEHAAPMRKGRSPRMARAVRMNTIEMSWAICCAELIGLDRSGK
ncbi:hypothetical protein ACE103_09035 [Bradyrhizobium sp. ma5]|uniref:hypothetical protein n=1 Tax=Bradyrhizobium sp. ma5 TaxID=3344828 RepID=UPI0035D4677A